MKRDCPTHFLDMSSLGKCNGSARHYITQSRSKSITKPCSQAIWCGHTKTPQFPISITDTGAIQQYMTSNQSSSHHVLILVSLNIFEPADSLLVVKLIGYFPENLFSAGNQVMPGYSEQLVPRKVDT